MAGAELPITTHILQACLTEPIKPLLDVVIVSSQMHVYISATEKTPERIAPFVLERAAVSH